MSLFKVQRRALLTQDNGYAPSVGMNIDDPVKAPFDYTANETTAVQRTIAFIDICGFVTFCDDYGIENARQALRRFRELVRIICARRECTVIRWTGDGVMLANTNALGAISCVVEVVNSCEHPQLRLRGGIASGMVLNIDGDDYMGKAVNLAARLCDIAEPREVLSDESTEDMLPNWIVQTPVATTHVTGLGEYHNLSVLHVAGTIVLPHWEI